MAEQNLEIVVDQLMDKKDADSVCHYISMCEASMSAIDHWTGNPSTISCTLCTTVGEGLKHFAEGNIDLTNVEESLAVYCKKTTNPYAIAAVRYV
jgi:hypothetical protein